MDPARQRMWDRHPGAGERESIHEGRHREASLQNGRAGGWGNEGLCRNEAVEGLYNSFKKWKDHGEP